MSLLFKMIALSVGLVLCGQAQASDIVDFKGATTKAVAGEYSLVQMDSGLSGERFLNDGILLEQRPISRWAVCGNRTCSFCFLGGAFLAAAFVVGGLLYLDFSCVSQMRSGNCTAILPWGGIP